MAARTTAQAGDWNTGSTWTGGVKPGTGDTATINHAVTVSTSEIVGTSPASDTTVVLTINAALTIQSTGTLKVRGTAAIANTTLTISGDGVLELDASQAGSPSSRHYGINIGTANGQANSYLVLAGSAGHRAVLRSNASGGNGVTRGGNSFTRGGKIKSTFGSFLRIGTSALHAAEFDLNSNSADQTYFDDTIFDTCGGIASVNGAMIDGTTFRLQRVNFKNSLANPFDGNAGKTTLSGASGHTTGDRLISYVAFDQAPEFFGPNGFTVDHCLFYQGWLVTSQPFETWHDNVVRVDDDPGCTATGDMGRTYFINAGDASNRHWLGADGDAGDMVLDGLIYELAGHNSGDTGDCMLISPGSSQLVTIKNAIVLPDADGLEAGALATIFGGSAGNGEVRIEHCTHVCVGATPGVSLEETSTGHVDQLQYYKNNLAWAPSPGASQYALNNVGDNTTDFVSAANVHHNGKWNLSTGSKGVGYNQAMTGTPGSGDVTGDPQFVDRSRNMAAWDLSLGGAGTAANAVAELAKIGADDWNSDYDPELLIGFVRGGFVVQNASYRTGAEDGSVMGAVQDAPTGGPRTATSSLAVPIGGSASAAVALSASSSKAVPVAGSVTAAVSNTASSSKAVSVAGSASAVVPMSASSSQPVNVGGSATALALIAASSSKAITVSGSAAAGVAVAASSTRSIGMAGSAAATVTLSLTSSQAVPISGSAAATVISGRVLSSDQTITMGGSALATVLATASSSASVAVSGLASAAVSVTTNSSLAVPIAGSAVAGSGAQLMSTRALPLVGAATAAVSISATSILPILFGGSAGVSTGAHVVPYQPEPFRVSFPDLRCSTSFPDLRVSTDFP